MIKEDRGQRRRVVVNDAVVRRQDRRASMQMLQNDSECCVTPLPRAERDQTRSGDVIGPSGYLDRSRLVSGSGRLLPRTIPPPSQFPHASCVCKQPPAVFQASSLLAPPCIEARAECGCTCHKLVLVSDSDPDSAAPSQGPSAKLCRTNAVNPLLDCSLIHFPSLLGGDKPWAVERVCTMYISDTPAC